MEVPLSTSIPTTSQVSYEPPSIPTVLSLMAFFTLLVVPTLLSNSYPVYSHQRTSLPDKVDTSTGLKNSAKSQIQSYSLDASLTIIFPLLLGVLFGPSVTSNSILSTSTQRTFIDIGYLGLLLLIFEAGVALDAESLRLMRENAALSIVAALTGVLVPIALSVGLGLGAYGYSGLQSFASGASLASTSLGTTLALLAPTTASPGADAKASGAGEGIATSVAMDLRRTRVGCVLVCAALLDDILGLVIAGIIPGLAQRDTDNGSGIQWQAIVRPILVSVAFGLGTPLAAMSVRRIVSRFPSWIPRPQYLFVLIILTLMAFVAGSGYAGTSELFGAYLAGAFVSHIFPAQEYSSTDSGNRVGDQLQNDNSMAIDDGENAAHAAFVAYIQPILTHLLAPLFFASIGAALPIKAMFTTHHNVTQITVVTVQAGSNDMTTTFINYGKTSHQVIWRGLVYAVLMVLAKMVVGLWMLIWPDKGTQKETRAAPAPTLFAAEDIESTPRCSPGQKSPVSPVQDEPPSSSNRQTDCITQKNEPPTELSRVRSALLLGLAMVARGEIALIVAQLARPLLIGPSPPSSTSTTSSGAATTITTRTPLPDEEPFAVVIWAILVSTIGGAVGVGALIASWKKKKH